MSVVTRFAPSPTGYLHIGGARTALFNWLFARRHGGEYLLRIEDTDRARSTDSAIAAILDGLDWLGLGADGQTTYQFARASRHREAAEEMVARGTAFRCYVTPEELDAHRKEAAAARDRLRAFKARLESADVQKAVTLDDLGGVSLDDLSGVSLDDLGSKEATSSAIAGKIAAAQADVERLNQAFRSPYRDGKRPPGPDAKYVIRLRAPDSGEIVNDDLVQGRVAVAARELDDLVLLRADATPTYMLAVVIDDHDMGVTHVIRGDDHLSNAARQIPIYDAMGWRAPAFAHLPMIHGPDGAKLSKRHGAQAVHEYRDLGYLPEAMTNYLARLGWSHGDDEIFTRDEAAAVFDLANVGRSPARLDFDKLKSVNAHYLRAADDARLAELVFTHIGAVHPDWPLNEAARARVQNAVSVLKARAKTIPELADQAYFLIRRRPLNLDPAAQKAMKAEAKPLIADLRTKLAGVTAWDFETIGAAIKTFATEAGVGMGQFGPSLRAALTGGAPSPDLAQLIAALGREETLGRIDDQLAG